MISRHRQSLEGILRINSAFKTVDVLGEMLRTYAGRLEGSMKVAITRECYQLSMRILGMFYKLFEDNLEALVIFVRSILEERSPETLIKSDVLEKRAKSFAFQLLTIMGDNALRRLANAVGAQKLDPIFDDLLIDAPISYEIMDFAIRTSTHNTLDISKLKKLASLTEKKFLPRNILTRIVLLHLYLFNNDIEATQKACHILGIDFEIAEYENRRGKQLKLHSK